jgi:hexosaminidase
MAAAISRMHLETHLGNRSSIGGLLALLLLSAPLAAHSDGAAGQTAPAAAAVGGFASAARMQLRWELADGATNEAVDVAASAPAAGGTRARLRLTNGDSRPLPAQGWALYFNVMDGAVSGPLPGKLVLDHVAGDLFRIRPAPDFPGLAPGATLDTEYRYAWRVAKLGKALLGPYLVYDAAPGVGTAIGDYRPQTVARPDRMGKGSATPADTWRMNAAADLLPAAALPPVLPTPLQLQTGPGQLLLRGRPTLSAPAALKGEAALAAALFPASLPAGGPPLRLSVGSVPGQASPEAYTLTVKAGAGIDIVGNSPAGVFYGLQSLRDLLPLPGAAAMALPEVAIVDAPRFGYRGFQLDVARNFQDKQTVLKWLDLMARYKMNTLHFHLTDDEGWRLEIAGLPELTDIGAVRGHSDRPGLRLQPAYGSGPDPRDPRGSGYFTRADYIEILRYAAARHIDVIPEIEMPGHARAAVQAMAARYRRLQAAGRADAARYLLHDAQDRSIYRSAQWFGDNVINPGLDSSFAFIEHVVTQVAALHRAAGVPLRTIHMGGDELASGAWEGSPASRARMRKEGLESTADLWDYFYERVDGILRKQGLYTSGWEELAARSTMLNGQRKLIPNPRFTRHGFRAWVWNNTEGAEDFAYRLANGGYDIVLAPVTKMYMDMAYNANFDEPGMTWGAYIELRDVYDFIPFDYLKNASPAARSGKDGLTDYGKRHVRGLEATIFAETLRDPARIDYMVMPRLLAVAERAWAPDPAWATEPGAAKAAAQQRAAWSGFVNALGQRVLPRLDREQPGVAYRIAPPGLLVEGDAVLVNHVLPGMVLRYTTDGSLPTAASALVAGPIRARGVIQAAAFDRNGRRGLVARVERP